MTFSQLSAGLPARYAAKLRRRLGASAALPPDVLRCTDRTADTPVTADAALLQILLDELLDYEVAATLTGDAASPDVPVLTLTATPADRFVRLTIENPALTLSPEELHDLFMPHRGGIPLLVVKQIIREHDTFMGHPGCRVQADALTSGGHAIWFTLPLAKTSQPSN